MNYNPEKRKDYKIGMGARLKTCRMCSNLTQENMAELLDISLKHYSEVERGIAGLSIEKLITLSDILGVTTDYLLKGTEDKDQLPYIIVDSYNSCPENKKFCYMELIKNINELMQP